MVAVECSVRKHTHGAQSMLSLAQTKHARGAHNTVLSTVLSTLTQFVVECFYALKRFLPVGRGARQRTLRTPPTEATTPATLSCSRRSCSSARDHPEPASASLQVDDALTADPMGTAPDSWIRRRDCLGLREGPLSWSPSERFRLVPKKITMSGCGLRF